MQGTMIALSNPCRKNFSELPVSCVGIGVVARIVCRYRASSSMLNDTYHPIPIAVTSYDTDNRQTIP